MGTDRPLLKDLMQSVSKPQRIVRPMPLLRLDHQIASSDATGIGSDGTNDDAQIEVLVLTHVKIPPRRPPAAYHCLPERSDRAPCSWRRPKANWAWPRL